MIQTIDLWIVSPESPAIIVSILGDFFLPFGVSVKPPAGVNLTEWPLSQTFIKTNLILILNL